MCGVPQESILGPRVFSIDICDLFFIDMSSDNANYADDTTPYKCAPYYDKLKKVFWNWFKIFNWFKANTTKCHFFLSSYQSASRNIDRSIFKSSNSQKLLVATIDSNFTFEEHINNLCRNLVKNYMHCPEYHNVFHQIRIVFCWKRF